MLPVEFFRQPWLGGLGKGERAGTDNQVGGGEVDAGLCAPPGALRTSWRTVEEGQACPCLPFSPGGPCWLWLSAQFVPSPAGQQPSSPLSPGQP